jgi:tRNA threonylcarbamoyladenosine biosynthesis protein TsaB
VKLLCWDTSSKTGAIAAIEWDPSQRVGWKGVRLVSEWTLNVDSTHSERLLWAIHQLLESARWKMQDVDIFGVGVGPGSFTGLRIGITTARTLAHTLGKPLIGISSLAALVRPMALCLERELKEKSIVVAATDACKGELFALWGLARTVKDCAAAAAGDRAGLWKRGVEERVLTADELVKALKRKLSETGRGARWAVVGEGRGRYSEVWAKLPAAREIQMPVSHGDSVQGRYVGMLAWEAFQAGLARAPLEIQPRYLRASDAELKLQARK